MATADDGRATGIWPRWRRWRRSRPFWGGLLVVLGGTEVLLSERAPLPLIIHIGLQGFAGYLIPIVMVLSGLLLLFHPVQRTFYSLLAIVLALGSWITSNLGGFFVGMLLGVIGGSLAFAWGPRDQSGSADAGSGPAPRHTRSAGLGLIRHDGSPEPGRPGEPTDDGRDDGAENPVNQSSHAKTSRGITAILTVPILTVPLAPFALSLLATTPYGVVTTAALPSLSSSLPPRLSASPSPDPTASPSPDPTASPSPDPTASPSQDPTASPTATPSPSLSPAPSPTKSRVRRVRVAGQPGALVATDQASLTGGLMVMTGLIYDGIARVPTIHGSELMLKFSMSSLTLSGNAVLTVTKDGNSLIAESGSVLELSGNVVLYATKLSADLDGIRVTFVPSRPLSRLRPDVTLTNVVADQPFATADSLWKIDRPGRETYLASVRKRPDSGLSGPPGIRRIRRTISSPRRRSAAAPSPE